MSVDLATTASATGADDVLWRIGRWVIMKVWLGCVLSAGYAVGHKFGWPELVLTLAAVGGALLLGLASLVLPRWTTDHWQYGVGIAVVDVGLRLLVWLALTSCVVSLLVFAPAAGAGVGALWLNTLARTLGPGLREWRDRRRERRAATLSAAPARTTSV